MSSEVREDYKPTSPLADRVNALRDEAVTAVSAQVTQIKKLEASLEEAERNMRGHIQAALDLGIRRTEIASMAGTTAYYIDKWLREDDETEQA